ncbi:MAG: hypothetical protein IPJ65_06045 [Archangiaceae bacterium]|nr:hypothetical protein [Archangiaceae bacterium]
MQHVGGLGNREQLDQLVERHRRVEALEEHVHLGPLEQRHVLGLDEAGRLHLGGGALGLGRLLFIDAALRGRRGRGSRRLDPVALDHLHRLGQRLADLVHQLLRGLVKLKIVGGAAEHVERGGLDVDLDAHLVRARQHSEHGALPLVAAAPDLERLEARLERLEQLQHRAVVELFQPRVLSAEQIVDLLRGEVGRLDDRGSYGGDLPTPKLPNRSHRCPS